MKFFTTVFHALGIASEVFASYCDYHDVLGGSRWVSTVKMTTLTDKTPHANTNPSKLRTTTERGSNMLLNLWENQQLKTTFSTRALLAVFGVTPYGSGMNALRSA